MGTGTTALFSIHQALRALTRFLRSFERSQRQSGMASTQNAGSEAGTASDASTIFGDAPQSAAATAAYAPKHSPTFNGRNLYVATSQPIQKCKTADLFSHRPSDQNAPVGSPQIIRKPLRIVHSRSGKDGGKLVISGRMADVCAELDRMAAREAALAYG